MVSAPTNMRSILEALMSRASSMKNVACLVHHHSMRVVIEMMSELNGAAANAPCYARKALKRRLMSAAASAPFSI